MRWQGLLSRRRRQCCAVAALAIKLTSPGPMLFAQERYGLNKRRFKMYKLRTMVVDAEAQQELELEAGNEASGPVFKIRDGPADHPGGPGPPAAVDRRAAPADQRPPR